MILVYIYLYLMFIYVKLIFKLLAKTRLIYPVIYLFLYSYSLKYGIVKTDKLFYPLLVVSFIPFIIAVFKLIRKFIKKIKGIVIRKKSRKNFEEHLEEEGQLPFHTDTSNRF